MYLQWQRSLCWYILSLRVLSLKELQKHNLSFPFLQPVDPIKLGIPNYPLVIKRPMDLDTVSKNLKKGMALPC